MSVVDVQFPLDNVVHRIAQDRKRIVAANTEPVRVLSARQQGMCVVGAGGLSLWMSQFVTYMGRRLIDIKCDLISSNGRKK